jgi:hypothetical protein
MVECQLKGLCSNSDEKYFLGHKCKEQKLFMAISEDVPEEDVIVSLVEEPSLPNATQEPTDSSEVDPLISFHSLIDFSSPQTLKLIVYIKHRKVIILVDSGSTHNFIHRRIAQETNFYIHVVNNFQIMIANGGSMKCGGVITLNCTIPAYLASSLLMPLPSQSHAEQFFKKPFLKNKQPAP